MQAVVRGASRRGVGQPERKGSLANETRQGGVNSGSRKEDGTVRLSDLGETTGQAGTYVCSGNPSNLSSNPPSNPRTL